MKVHNKLVRDLIPQIISESGRTPVYETLPPDQYLLELGKKLVEEAREYQAEPCMEEIADLLEVVDSICAAQGYDIQEILSIKAHKKEERGGFEKKLYLRHVL